MGFAEGEIHKSGNFKIGSIMKKSLELIKRANITGEGNDDNIYRELRNIIEGITKDYTEPQNLSDEKYDMTETIKRYGYSVEEYKSMFGSVMRSEQDVVRDLAKALVAKKYVSDSDVPKSTASDDEKKKKAIAFKFKLKLQLQLAGK